MGSYIDRILIVGIVPYFLEKGNVWFQENLQHIVEARATQPFFQENTLLLEKNQTLSLSELLRKLDELGYEKVFEVRDPGEFSHKGGTVDLFPINLAYGVQIEFLGNTIERIEKSKASLQDEAAAKAVLKKRFQSQKLFSDLKGLKPAEYVVHLDHGVAQFTGIQTIGETPYYVLQYAKGDTLFVPVGLERKLSRYVGFVEPAVSRLGSPFWIKTKKRIREEVEKLALQLLDLYAQRETSVRPPYHVQGEILQQVEGSFPYKETPDQLQAIEDVKKDLTKQEPMDRLVCGDVGFGKTEIALRSVVMAVENGYQAAVLCPTTILAYQHFQNFKERLRDLPVRIALLSRIQSNKEQKDIVEKLRTGAVDIVIGTHRLLSHDIAFQKLGLLVIDDEQKFGVRQKEKLRELRTSLDVLSLSATPIPRTLYMTLSSLKSMSMVQTPPLGRSSVQTVLAKWSAKAVAAAIQKEMERTGQVYYLHNRIGTIQPVQKMLEKLAQKARIVVAHGRMGEKELIRVMDAFKNKAYDVLIATTIIENGLDLPNVNTLIVADAAKLGLSQAYQIRGRIGRSDKKAFAYFLYGAKPSGKARLRLDALKEAEDLGSGRPASLGEPRPVFGGTGYRIALKDLEIRGAGNILGKEQSGDINTVGLNLYCQMLAEAVERMRTSDAKSSMIQ